MRKSAIISTILMRISLFLYTIKQNLCRFETWSLNVFKFNDVILNDVMGTSYRATRCTSIRSPFHQLLAGTLAHNTMAFPLKMASLVTHTLSAAFYPRKKTLSIRVDYLTVSIFFVEMDKGWPGLVSSVKELSPCSNLLYHLYKAVFFITLFPKAVFIISNVSCLLHKI